MSKKTKIIIAVVAVLILAGIGSILNKNDSENASNAEITAFKFRDASSINLELSDNKYTYSTPDVAESYVTVECDDSSKTTEKDIVFVSDNENIAIIEFANASNYGNRYNFKVTAKGAGTTTVYVKSADGKVVSSKITVNVVDKRTTKEDVTESSTTTTTTTTTTEEYTTTTTTTTTRKPGRTVYVTPSGEKYHFDKECAGKNAIARDFNDVKDSYGACGTCVN